ncbi:hypothetical protein ACH5RR_041860 [Cinchona calisaya]|uniref:Uncharacterized protein n=1 Tax=Cinchona calisaya TaxID=153742 RepID=A0ABD2Y086_9GENT
MIMLSWMSFLFLCMCIGFSSNLWYLRYAALCGRVLPHFGFVVVLLWAVTGVVYVLEFCLPLFHIHFSLFGIEQYEKVKQLQFTIGFIPEFELQCFWNCWGLLHPNI